MTDDRSREKEARPLKVVIVGGAGGVGSTAAFNLLIAEMPYEVVIVDSRSNLIQSHVMDFEQILPLGSKSSVRRGELNDIADAAVVVITASVPLRLNTSRAVFLKDNAALLAGIVDALSKAGLKWPGIFILVTNPIDPLNTWLQRAAGIDRRRVIGYTLNDTLRFRGAIARVLQVQPSSIEAWSLGEHGERPVLLFDRITVDGAPAQLTPEQRRAVEEDIGSWYVRHVALDSGRTTTWGTGLGVARMIEAIAANANAIWPASLVLDGEYETVGTSITVPVTLSRHGVAEIHRWRLSGDEAEGFRQSVERIRIQAEAI